MFKFICLIVCLIVSCCKVRATAVVYLIRHGEKPERGNSLSTQGIERARCLTTVFGKESMYNITHIMAQTPRQTREEGKWVLKRQRPLDTVKPLANDLAIPIDTSCDRDDMRCVVQKIMEYDGPGNILLCWEHHKLSDIVSALGAHVAPKYPSDEFDTIWTDPPPYTHITAITSEHCQGLDSL